jgi:oxygen-dependent protoporphyrinogen oxidase
LALAYRLRQAVPEVEITLLEKDSRTGGTVLTEQHNGFRVEGGPNGFLDTKTSTIALCRDLGLGERLLPASPTAQRNRYLFLKGRLHRLGPGMLLGRGVLSWRGKWDLIQEPFRRSVPASADETVDAFFRRRAGAEAAEILADALVTGIHGGDPTLLSMRAIFPRLVELESRHGSVLKGLRKAAGQRRVEAKARGEVYQRPGRLWSFREGLKLLIDTLHGCLPQPPLLGVRVRSVRPQGNPAANPSSWKVCGEGREEWTADAVVLTCPAYEQAEILADLDAELAQFLKEIPYNRIVVLALGYRRENVAFPFDGFGFLSPQRQRRDLLGVQWCSSIYPDRAPEGLVLMRALCGGWNRGDIVDWDDARLLQAVRAELQLAMGVSGDPVFHRIIRWDHAIPQYHVGHLERVARIKGLCRRYPGLFLGGNSYHGVALNDCTEQAEVQAQGVAQYLQKVIQ